jgi:hypothetical protein
MTNFTEVSARRRSAWRQPGPWVSLYRKGLRRIKEFCLVNGLAVPEVVVVPKAEWEFKQVAYYRLGKKGTGVIKVCVEKCTLPATPEWVRNWSWPGSKIDVTPYGVLAHELGHHADVIRSGVTNPYAYRGRYSSTVFDRAKEKPISPYNGVNGRDGPTMTEEWFAEAFRVFVCNPALLAFLRPRTFDVVWRKDGWTPLYRDQVHDILASRTWKRGLAPGCPDRVIRSLERAAPAPQASKAR